MDNSAVTRVRVAQLIDGVRDEPADDMTITLRGRSLAAIERSSPSDEPSPGSTIDFGPTSTALPGLVDAHTHFSLPGDGRSYESMAAESDETLAIVAARNAGIHLRSGVTTARDNGARNRLGFVIREAIERGIVDGPRLLVSGRPVTPSGGHFHWCNGTADGEDEIRAAVRRLVAEGADHVKVMASGGGTAGTDPTRASYSTQELVALVEIAHDLGRLTTAHCRAAVGMQRAIEAGVDCMEHGEFLQLDGEMRFDRELARRLVDSDLYLSPTLQAKGWDTILRLRALRNNDRLDAAGAARLAATERELETRVEHTHELIEMGFRDRLVCGTDAGCSDFSFGHMDYGISLMIRAGLTPMQAIKSATSVAAAACGVAEEVGTIELGKQADILVVDGDPLTDTAALGRPLAVFKAGHLVPRIASSET